MDKKSQDNSLIKVNKNSIIYKIKLFFKKIFKPKEIFVPIKETPKKQEEEKTITQKPSSNAFLERIKNIDDEHTLLLKLQKQYENGEVLEDNLTPKQVDDLCALYETQIEELKKKISNIQKQIIQYQNS